jgi:hypothetical protein
MEFLPFFHYFFHGLLEWHELEKSIVCVQNLSGLMPHISSIDVENHEQLIQNVYLHFLGNEKISLAGVS